MLDLDTRNKLIISIIPGAKGQHIKISSIQKVDFESPLSEPRTHA
jgi:hypothetical protein